MGGETFLNNYWILLRFNKIFIKVYVQQVFVNVRWNFIFSRHYVRQVLKNHLQTWGHIAIWMPMIYIYKTFGIKCSITEREKINFKNNIEIATWWKLSPVKVSTNLHTHPEQWLNFIKKLKTRDICVTKKHFKKRKITIYTYNGYGYKIFSPLEEMLCN